MKHYLDFEKPIADLDIQISELQAIPDFETNEALQASKKRLANRVDKQLKDIYKKLTPWQKCQVARHPDRPHYIDYVNALFTECTLLAGDRNFSDDQAVLGYLARFDDKPVVVIGQEKGHDTKSRLVHNFGMARPEGYRKAIRLMDLADKFRLPVIAVVDTPGAYPGLGAEERGQSEAIARTIEKSLEIGVPIISVIIGEGGSGGAVALATADRNLMLENSIYSVISPEGCASILWKNSEMMSTAANALKLTATDMKEYGVIDKVIPEPVGGAHRDPYQVYNSLRTNLRSILKEIGQKRPNTLRKERIEKFKNMGLILEKKAPKRRVKIL